MVPKPHHIDILTAADIAARPALLHTLFELINTAFRGRPGFPVPRFFADDDVLDNLGSQGLCSVMFDANDDTQPIATASTKPWTTDSSGTDFELSVVATSPKHRGLGYADQCARAVEVATVARRAGSGGVPVARLWLNTIEHHNREYWTRRGFAVAKSRVGPAGMWGAERDFVMVTMVRPAAASFTA